jgi:RNA polymerase sigma-70 factor (ECF subfamily)
VPATPAELFERHHRALYRYLLRMTSSREQAEDLTQEVFVRVMKATDAYQEQNSERAWLFRIARNLRCDLARQHSRQGVPSALTDGGPAQGPRQLVRLGLTRAIAALPDEEREAFVLAEIGGLTYEEIALVCSITPAAVRSRIYRARVALRASLSDSVFADKTFVRGNHG